jgi:hypothetical protein
MPHCASQQNGSSDVADGSFTTGANEATPWSMSASLPKAAHDNAIGKHVEVVATPFA